MQTLANITVIGSDKAGVIARVTQFLFQSGANVEELEQQVTRGQFSMWLQASWEDARVDADALKRGLEELARELHMEVRTRFIAPHPRPRLALLVTREAECPTAVLEALAQGTLAADVPLMIGNHRDLEPLAARYRVPFFHVDYSDRAAAEQRVLELLDEHQANWVVLARFMKILSPNFVWRYKNKIINIHPSLLPAFPGASAYRQAYERGVKIIGVTAHLVTMDLDEGPILCQDCFQVDPKQSLSEITRQGRQLEARVLVRGIQICLENRLDVHWGVVHAV